jgi:hypothetical protein
MASVRGTDPCLAAGSGPDCVTTNRNRDTTYVGTGPYWLPGHWYRKEKVAIRGQKKIGQPKRTHLNQRKEVRIAFLFAFAFAFVFAFAFAFALAFALHLFLFHDLKASKLKKSQRQRKNGSPDPAILGRVRTRDPDPGHFGPDFASGSGHGSAFTDPQSGACLRSTDEGDFRTDFGL